jgi:hypothetical protein
MLSWKEYPRTVGGLSKYLNWFKDFKRPMDILKTANSKDKSIVKTKLSLFGKKLDSGFKINFNDIEQGSVGDNYLLTVIAGLAQRGFVQQLFAQN